MDGTEEAKNQALPAQTLKPGLTAGAGFMYV
jgi:hypothetical protein